MSNGACATNLADLSRSTDQGKGPLRRARGARRLLLGLLRYVRPHRKYAALTIVFGVTGFALSFVYPWIIGNVVDVLSAPSTSRSLAEREATLVTMTELAGAAAVMHAVVVYGRGHCNVHLGHAVVTDLRRALFDHIQGLSLRFFTKERTGSIQSRIMHDVHEAAALIYTGVLVAAMDAVQLFIAVVLLAAISWKLTAACVALFPLYAMVFAVLNPRVRSASERMHGQFCRISGNVSEQLAGQAVIKTFAAEERESRRFGRELRRHHELVTAQSHEGHLVAGSGEVLVHLGTTIVVGYGGWLALAGELTPGMLTRFLGYMLIMFGPVRRFAELNITYQTSLSAMRRVFRVFDIAPTIVEPPRPLRSTAPNGDVRFEEVRFRYDERTPETSARLDDDAPASWRSKGDRSSSNVAWVLDGVSLEARRGERVAIVGPSGSGKTTLVSLIPRLYDVVEGRLSIDGVDVRDYSLHALRAAIGVVQQDTFVFSGTVRDNLAYGRPGASDDEIVRASVAAHAHEFILRLPDGYDTCLGERGVNLSGGQRQRLSIARALLRDPRILILDEATSALDAESEAVVQEALEVVMKGRTCFVVAHRLSTIRNADRIVVLERGRVAEVGTHDDLVARGGAYSLLVRHQTRTGRSPGDHDAARRVRSGS
ncbi:MAG TPA: ABC transporter ATP-binding protein [Labilithrix sp.]|nr:ABC transporter ATP-binding protein [Labilithrix sp.]